MLRAHCADARPSASPRTFAACGIPAPQPCSAGPAGQAAQVALRPRRTIKPPALSRSPSPPPRKQQKRPAERQERQPKRMQKEAAPPLQQQTEQPTRHQAQSSPATLAPLPPLAPLQPLAPLLSSAPHLLQHVLAAAPQPPQQWVIVMAQPQGPNQLSGTAAAVSPLLGAPFATPCWPAQLTLSSGAATWLPQLPVPASAIGLPQQAASSQSGSRPADIDDARGPRAAESTAGPPQGAPAASAGRTSQQVPAPLPPLPRPSPVPAAGAAEPRRGARTKGPVCQPPLLIDDDMLAFINWVADV